MRIAFIADGRAENFRRLVQHFAKQDDTVYVLSTYPCGALEGAQVYTLPGIVRANNALVKQSDMQDQVEWQVCFGRRLLLSELGQRLFPLWNIVKTINMLPQMLVARRILRSFKPDIVVAFRTQNEGYVAALTGIHPWVLFTQGSDFIYMANRHRLHAWLTSITAQRADALMTDCQRDIDLAKQYGFSKNNPSLLLPGNGGVDLSIYQPGVAASQRERWVVYPRGLAPFIRLDTLLQSILMLQKEPDYSDIRYKLFVTTAVIPKVESMVHRQRLNMNKIEILPFTSQNKFAAFLQKSAVIVSPSLTDGTPNSMLEAMACGAFPVISDLESIREWIRHGENGLLFDPTQPQDLTNCLKVAIDNVVLRQQAQEQNLEIIHKRADYKQVMPKLKLFLKEISDI
ncbi:MAG: glycosyltransferase family 4 protein [Proteobacteria bacterium]|nr:glycosyltransferase family 4 protein [Pseudomonadota bacterium]